MGHSRLFDEVRRVMRLATQFERGGIGTEEGLEREAARRDGGLTRRGVVQGAASLAALGLGLGAGRVRASGGPRIAIVGGGLAGLVCADRLRAMGYTATIYEANTRVGGRVHSAAGTFPGQVAELGGELIDNLHKTMLAYANEFGLLKEDLGKAPGEKRFFVGGQHYTEAQIVDEYRQLVPAMRADLQTCSASPTARSHTAGDVVLDNLDLGAWLASRAAGVPVIRSVLEQAYIAEYGLEVSQQSSLNFLLFAHADRSSKFREYGVFSDERYHLVGGNDAVAQHIAARLPGPMVFGAELVRLAKNASGTFELTFRGASTPELADAVVLAIPFTTLRRVQLDASLGLTADKMHAIDTLGYGANAKTMVGFDGRPWAEQGGNGLIYADLPNVQTTWETNSTRAGATSVLTDYAGGAHGLALQSPPPPLGQTSTCNNCHNGPGGFMDLQDAVLQQQVDGFLTDLDRVVPGAKARATRVGGKYVVRRGHWSTQRYSRGSYTCYLPGQFTTVAGLEGTSAGLLKFAGEHTDSFYSWQGFMEGACLSGLAAANELLDDVKRGRL
ncbi:MAG: flavin monoamine oxidase family protein [Myxococcota bacterium]